MTLSTSFQNFNGKFSTDGQQSPILHLGQLALSDLALADLMTQAAALISQVIAVEILFIWELEQDHHSLSLKTCLGWQNGSTGSIRKPLEPNSLEQFTLASASPIII